MTQKILNLKSSEFIPSININNLIFFEKKEEMEEKGEIKQIKKKKIKQKKPKTDLGKWEFPIYTDKQAKKDKLKEEDKKTSIIIQKPEKKPYKFNFLKNIGKELSKFGKKPERPINLIKYKAIGPGHEELIKKTSKRLSKLKRNLLNYLNNSIKLKEDQQYLNENYESDEEKKEISTKKTNIFRLNTIKTHINIISHPQKTINSMEIRDWVDHMISEEIDIRVMKLINELNYVQTIKKITQPRKFKKRIVAGFKEVLRTLDTTFITKQSKCVIFAINIQKDPNPEGIDQKVIEILTKATDLGCLIIHSCSRRKLGLAFNGKMGPKISIISIIDYQSYEENFLELKAIVQEKRNEYLININKS